MTQAKQGDIVTVNYTGALDDGTIFDSSQEHGPLTFTIGEGYMIEGFEQAVIGMSQSETKIIKILAQDAYGPYQQELVAAVEKSQLPVELTPEIGMQLKLGSTQKDSFVATITDITENQVTLDANHPLAGKDLTFQITLVSID
jgi:peptidylprolyl isomerase